MLTTFILFAYISQRALKYSLVIFIPICHIHIIWNRKCKYAQRWHNCRNIADVDILVAYPNINSFCLEHTKIMVIRFRKWARPHILNNLCMNLYGHDALRGVMWCCNTRSTLVTTMACGCVVLCWWPPLIKRRIEVRIHATRLSTKRINNFSLISRYIISTHWIILTALQVRLHIRDLIARWLYYLYNMWQCAAEKCVG